MLFGYLYKILIEVYWFIIDFYWFLFIIIDFYLSSIMIFIILCILFNYFSYWAPARAQGPRGPGALAQGPRPPGHTGAPWPRRGPWARAPGPLGPGPWAPNILKIIKIIIENK